MEQEVSYIFSNYMRCTHPWMEEFLLLELQAIIAEIMQ